jgi:hypothetical protein
MARDGRGLVVTGGISVKKKIVYILSANLAGSHYLPLLLGGGSRACHADELFQFDGSPQRRKLRDVFLTQRRLFEGIGMDNIEQVYDMVFSRIDPKILVLADNSEIICGWMDRFVDDDRYDRRTRLREPSVAIVGLPGQGETG